MKYRRALLLADLHADPQPALSALRSVAPALEHIFVVAKVRSLGSWWSTTPSREADEHEQAALNGWRQAASRVAPTELHQAQELPLDAFVDLALTDGADLLVASTRSVDAALLLARAARRLAVAALWPGGEPRHAPVERLLAIAMGGRERASLATFVREHGDPSLAVALVAAADTSADELGAALQVVGIQSPVDLLPRAAATLRGALDAALSHRRFDLVVLPRMPTLLLLRYPWPAPVLVVPPAPPARPRSKALDIADVVEVAGNLRARVDEVTAVGSLAPVADAVVALVAQGGVLATAMTTPFGDLDLPAGVTASWLGAVRVVDDTPPDALAALEHRFAVLRPQPRPLLLFDCELPIERLPAVREAAHAAGAEPLAVRLRPTHRVSALRRRLQSAGLSSHVVDARAVLDEGDAHDVAEANDPVRLRRVAARMRAAGFTVAAVLDRLLDAPEPLTDVPAPAIAGNAIEVELDNARARRWLLDGIRASRRSVDVQVYMALDDEVGRAIDAALVDAGARGVTVRVLVDSLHGLHGSFGTENPLLSRLATHPGVELRVSRPLTRLPSLNDLKVRDHRKIVILDGRTALVGGRNFSHEYYTGFEEAHLTAAAPWRQVPWLDGGARIEGPAVGQIAAAFRAAWIDAGGATFPIEATPPVGTTAVRVVVHRGLGDAHTLEAYLDLVDSARSHVFAVNGFPYVLELQHALLRALSRGVQVRAVTGHLTPTHDGTPFSGAMASARSTATEFVHSRLDPIVEAGGEVYLFARRGVPGWQDGLGVVHPHVHAKVLSVDGQRCAVGSANFDVTSSYWESELMLVVEDATVTRTLEAQIEQLIAGSTPVDRDDPAWQERARRRRWMRRWPGVLAI